MLWLRGGGRGKGDKIIHPERVREHMAVKFTFELDACVMSQVANELQFMNHQSRAYT